jgi:hypothetical protein
MWYSKHHYAAQLAKTHTVFFVSSPTRWRLRDLISFGVKVHEVPEGVKVVEYRNNLPLSLLTKGLADRVAGMNARKLHKLAPPGDLLHWCFHPTQVVDQWIARAPGSLVIYHAVDPYHDVRHDSAFATACDLVVAVNPWYVDRYKQLNANCLLVPHGVSGEDRQYDDAAVADAGERWGRYAILAASLSQSVNYTLLTKVALRYARLRLVIAGELFPLDEKTEVMRETLLALPNVVYVGVKHPNQLRSLIRGAALGLISYDVEPTLETPVKATRTPLKVLTYLSQLRPVVSTNNSYVPALETRGHFKAESEDHFVRLVGDVLDGSITVDRSAVDRYLDSVDYRTLIQVILRRLAEVAASKRAPDVE